MHLWLWRVVLVAGVFVFGCDNRTGGWDGNLPDGQDADAWDGGGDLDGGDAGDEDSGDGDGVDGGDLPPADDGPPAPWQVGSEETFEVVTWNIQNFPKNIYTAERMVEFIAGMKVDLVAVQEITDEDAFDWVVDQLPQYDGILSDDTYSSGDYQKTGFIFRSDFMQLRSVVSLFQSEWYAFPRPPLQGDFVVHRPDGTIFDFIAIVLHLKASSGEENEDRRRNACIMLKNHLDNLLAAGTESEIMLLGDFNDRLNDSANDNVFTVFLDQPDTYRFLTDELVGTIEYSYIPSRVLIDHILVTADLFGPFDQGWVQAVELDQLVEGFDYVDTVSDHRPMAAVFPF